MTGGWGAVMQARALLRVTAIAYVLTAAGVASAAPGDCRDCHLGADAALEIPDLLEYFRDVKRHHPVGVGYPRAHDISAGYHFPTGTAGELRFFDRDGDGVADEDEIRLFGAGATVECASCHREHVDGSARAPGDPPAFLRRANDDSGVCLTCHRK